MHIEAFAGRRRSDQLDDDLVADQRLAAPVLGDEGEQTVLDPVPFAGAGRQMATVMAMPSSLAKLCNSRFHSRTRAPLLPPQSAVISRRWRRG